MSDEPSTIPPGRIDIHSHMLPDIDDGCRNIEECVESIAALQHEGFVGSICTPHIWMELYPANTVEQIRHWTRDLSDRLVERRIDYRLWSGAEVRLFPQVVDWMKNAGVPTLADSKCVLVDMWLDRWPRWVNRAMDWLLEEGYQPILAHPERINIKRKIKQRLIELVDQGVWLQGNFRCMTGEDGPLADTMVRQLLAEDRYTFMSLDMHRPGDLTIRIDGMDMTASENGQRVLDRLTIENPRKLIFQEF